MRLASVSEDLIEYKLGNDVYNDLGSLLLGKGVVLTSTFIEKLIDHDIFTVLIDDPFSEGIEPKSLVGDEQMIVSVNAIKGILTKMSGKKKLGISAMILESDIEVVDNVIKDLMDHLDNCQETLYTVINLMGADMYTYKHCVNVSVLTILTCRSLGYDYELTKHIALGALLHDIGKSAVEDQLIQKSEKLSESEQIEVFKHVEYGYEMIKNVLSLSGYTKQIVRLHHEKRDGSGYPLGLKETEIPDFVRIVTICDMFDAMTSDRIYRKAMPPYQAIEILMADSTYRLDPTILSLFLQNICIYPPGTGVVLSDQRKGLVTSYNKYNPTRPNVRVFENEMGQLEVGNVDLEANRVLFIEASIDTKIIVDFYNL